MSQLILAIYNDLEQANKTYAEFQSQSNKFRQKIGHMCVARKEGEHSKTVRHAPEASSSQQGVSNIQADWFESLVGQVLFYNESLSVKGAGESEQKFPESSEESSPQGKVQPAPGSVKEEPASKKGRVKEYESDLISIYGIEDQFVSQVRSATGEKFSAIAFYLDRGESSDLVNELKQKNAQVFNTSMISGQQQTRKAA